MWVGKANCAQLLSFFVSKDSAYMFFTGSHDQGRFASECDIKDCLGDLYYAVKCRISLAQRRIQPGKKKDTAEKHIR